jgi:hypothetical protein
MIAIFDYGAGNLRGDAATLGELGCDYTLVRDSEACAPTKMCSRSRPLRPDDAA